MRRSLSVRELDGDGAHTASPRRPSHRRDRSAGSALDLSGATIDPLGQADGPLGDVQASPSSRRAIRDEAPTIVLPNQEASSVGHFALDIGGSLIKIVYFTPGSNAGSTSGGRLHFVKFETSKVDLALDFIEQKQLHLHSQGGGHKAGTLMRIKATGGGAYKFADAFKRRLGVVIEKEDEMECLVQGANFLLQAIRDEAFTFIDGRQTFVPITSDGDVFPYLLVNIGSGVSLIKVDSLGKFERVSGTSLGGGTFWGLCRLLTRAKTFDEMLELSMQGDNTKVDMLVGDIYGGLDYEKIGLSSKTIASSFGRVVAENKQLEDFQPADLALALMRMVSYNIAQIAYLNAQRYRIRRVFFGGFFIRGHPYTMETISYAFKFWSKGEIQALFLRHEGFLGSMGAFLKVSAIEEILAQQDRGVQRKYSATGKVRAKFAERFSMGAPFLGGEVQGPVIGSVEQKVTWVERFIEAGTARGAQEDGGVTGEGEGDAGAAGTALEGRGEQGRAFPAAPRSEGPSSGTGRLEPEASSMDELFMSGRMPSYLLPSRRMQLHVGILQFSPMHEPFPLLADIDAYEPNTLDIVADPGDRQYWLGILRSQVPLTALKAVESEGASESTRRRAAAFERALTAHLTKLIDEPGVYGRLGLAEVFELREECLREFNFKDVYKLDKERENKAAMEVLPDLLAELDKMGPRERLVSLVEGVLAANIFDWGSKACEELYRNGTILEIYKQARSTLSRRPWRVDEFDRFEASWFADDIDRLALPRDPQLSHAPHTPETASQTQEAFYQRALLFVDNSGADVVLGMIPLARELLRHGSDVVLVANSLPAINDVTATELESLLAACSEIDATLSAAWRAGLHARASHGGQIPPRATSRAAPSSRLSAARDTGSRPASRPTSAHSPHAAAPGPSSAGRAPWSSEAPRTPAGPAMAHTGLTAGGSGISGSDRASPGIAGDAHAPPPPRLFVVGSGQGSPCLDLRRVSRDLADACEGADLLVIEGMGRAIHTNLRTRFRCDCLKLAMVKNQRLAEALFGGQQFDCICLFEPAVGVDRSR